MGGGGGGVIKKNICQKFGYCNHEILEGKQIILAYEIDTVVNTFLSDSSKQCSRLARVMKGAELRIFPKYSYRYSSMCL